MSTCVYCGQAVTTGSDQFLYGPDGSVWCTGAAAALAPNVCVGGQPVHALFSMVPGY